MTTSASSISPTKRNNAQVTGAGRQTIVFAHGYGCDQTVWRKVSPAFHDEFQVVTFDLVGAGASDISTYDSDKYATLHGYADDLIDLCVDLDLSRVTFVGHSVSAMIGCLAASKVPGLFDRMILIAPSPCYTNDGEYKGGFTQADIDEMLSVMEHNFVHWSSSMAPVIMNSPDQPHLANDLANGFCRLDPVIAKQFAQVTFKSDHRSVLPHINVAALILQCDDDAIAPLEVGQYMAESMPGGTLQFMAAKGHCPHLSAPDETVALIRQYLVEAKPTHA